MGTHLNVICDAYGRATRNYPNIWLCYHQHRSRVFDHPVCGLIFIPPDCGETFSKYTYIRAVFYWGNTMESEMIFGIAWQQFSDISRQSGKKRLFILGVPDKYPLLLNWSQKRDSKMDYFPVFLLYCLKYVSWNFYCALFCRVHFFLNLFNINVLQSFNIACFVLS